MRRWVSKGPSMLVYVLIVQFQPREFSAIMGAEICWVRAEFPVLPLPLLFLCSPGDTRPPGVTRPPDMKALAPPIKAGLPDCLISDGFVRELDRRWLALRFLYLLATKNMAAPYKADPAMAATAIPAVVPLTADDWFCDSVLKTPAFPFPAGVLEVAELPLPVAVALGSRIAPA